MLLDVDVGAGRLILFVVLSLLSMPAMEVSHQLNLTAVTDRVMPDVLVWKPKVKTVSCLPRILGLRDLVLRGVCLRARYGLVWPMSHGIQYRVI